MDSNSSPAVPAARLDAHRRAHLLDRHAAGKSWLTLSELAGMGLLMDIEYGVAPTDERMHEYRVLRRLANVDLMKGYRRPVTECAPVATVGATS